MPSTASPCPRAPTTCTAPPSRTRRACCPASKCRKPSPGRRRRTAAAWPSPPTVSNSVCQCLRHQHQQDGPCRWLELGGERRPAGRREGAATSTTSVTVSSNGGSRVGNLRILDVLPHAGDEQRQLLGPDAHRRRWSASHGTMSTTPRRPRTRPPRRWQGAVDDAGNVSGAWSTRRRWREGLPRRGRRTPRRGDRDACPTPPGRRRPRKTRPTTSWPSTRPTARTTLARPSSQRRHQGHHHAGQGQPRRPRLGR